VSIVGNAAGHLASTGHLSQGLVLVVLVGAVPPAGLAAAIHLAVLRGKDSIPDAAPVPAEKPKPAPTEKPAAKKAAPKKTAPKPSSDKTVDEVLVHRAKKLDDEWRVKHGKPISRDDARPLLGVSNEKTGEALRLARQEGVAS
jgi:cell division septation protein DedD